MKGISKIPN